jgi:hypothetical protein
VSSISIFFINFLLLAKFPSENVDLRGTFPFQIFLHDFLSPPGAELDAEV